MRPGKLDVDNASPYGEHDFNPAWYVDLDSRGDLVLGTC